MLPSPSIGCWHGGQRGRTPSRPAAPLPRRFDRRVGKRRQAPRHLTTLLRRAGAPVRREAPPGCRGIVAAAGVTDRAVITFRVGTKRRPDE